MTDDSRLTDQQVIDSWHHNANAWTNAVRAEQIESRKLVTNAAVIEAVISRQPRTVLDVGCGEGWLARALADRGLDVYGVDVVPELIDSATRQGGAKYRVLSYEALALGGFEPLVDLAVANFALIGAEAVDDLVRSARGFIRPGGSFVIQTLHPVVGTGTDPYRDGWRPGSWSGFGPEFTNPAPWYFRTLETWVRLITEGGLRLVEMREPVHPRTGLPASVIFVAELRRPPLS